MLLADMDILYIDLMLICNILKYLNWWLKYVICALFFFYSLELSYSSIVYLYDMIKLKKIIEIFIFRPIFRYWLWNSERARLIEKKERSKNRAHFGFGYEYLRQILMILAIASFFNVSVFTWMWPWTWRFSIVLTFTYDLVCHCFKRESSSSSE